MSDQFSPALLLNSCHSLSFKSHIYSQMAFILQGKENAGSAILSYLLKVTKTVIKLGFSPRSSYPRTLTHWPCCLVCFLGKVWLGCQGWVLKTFPRLLWRMHEPVKALNPLLNGFQLQPQKPLLLVHPFLVDDELLSLCSPLSRCHQETVVSNQVTGLSKGHFW